MLFRSQLCIAPLIINSELIEKLKNKNSAQEEEENQMKDSVSLIKINSKSNLTSKEIKGNLSFILRKNHSRDKTNELKNLKNITNPKLMTNMTVQKYRGNIVFHLDPLSEERDYIIKKNIEWNSTHNGIAPTTMNHYKIIKLIGKGAFGKVSMGIHKLTGKYVAIKTIEKKHMKNEYSRKKVLQEVYILKNIKHSNVIKYYY